MPDITPGELRNDNSRIRGYQTRAEIAATVATLPAIDAAQLRADLDNSVDGESRSLTEGASRAARTS